MIERPRGQSAKPNYGSFALEIVVVILGILIAFQIDRWAEYRRDRDREYDYLVRLKDDLQSEIKSMDAALRQAESRIAAVLLLEEALENPSVAREQPEAVVAAVETVTWRSFPQINAFIYSELQSTGNLSLIRSENLRRELANHYSSIRHHERVGLDLNIQHHFDRLTAGILTTAELQNIESGSWEESTRNISMERALEVCRELARRQNAVDLLPNIAQHHVFNKKVMEVTRSRTQKLSEMIESLIEEMNH